MAKNHPDVKFYLSHTCEYSTNSASELKKRIDIIKRFAPSCIPVNNVMTGPTTPGVLTETHKLDSALKGKYLCSTDGMSVTNMDMASWNKTHAKAEIRFLWASLFNLREEDENLPPPLQRTAVPSEEYMRAIVRLSQPQGAVPVPTFKGKIIPIKRPILLKAFAEDGPGTDVRSNRPLLISPAADGRPLDIVDMNGKKVCTFAFFGHYPVGNRQYQRHYSGTGSGLWGYQIEDKAAKQSGSPYTWAKDGNNYYGPFLAGRRRGYF
jgi:hypothetical protein